MRGPWAFNDLVVMGSDVDVLCLGPRQVTQVCVDGDVGWECVDVVDEQAFIVLRVFPFAERKGVRQTRPVEALPEV